MFERYGKIDDAMIINDRKTGMSRGFGFVYYQNSEDAIVAKEETNGLEIDGNVLSARHYFFILKTACPYVALHF